MVDSPALADFIERLRAILAAEYRRGQDDALRRIIEAAQGEASARTTVVRSEGVGIETAPPRLTRQAPVPKKRRAPVGVPDSLLSRVLRERGEAGATVNEVLGAAHPGTEQLVSVSGVRFAFDRGKQQGIYRSSRGRWFLAEPSDKPDSPSGPFELEEEKN